MGPFGYAGSSGYQEDSDSGLKLLGHRYYDPSTGRFLTRDPAWLGRNWYTYCENNPTNATDPTGLDTRGIGGQLSGQIVWDPFHHTVTVGGKDHDGNSAGIVFGGRNTDKPAKPGTGGPVITPPGGEPQQMPNDQVVHVPPGWAYTVPPGWTEAPDPLHPGGTILTPPAKKPPAAGKPAPKAKSAPKPKASSNSGD